MAKVGHLLSTQVGPQQGVAAMTYTRRAAGEITTRLGRLGLRPGSRLTASTVHGWCLAAVLRPYNDLAGQPPISAVAGESRTRELGSQILSRVGLPHLTGLPPELTRARRAIAVGSALDSYDPRLITAATAFDEALTAHGLLDHDSMVSRAFTIVDDHPKIARLVAARFPWLVIDEYQDLGPVLHALVTTLHTGAGAQVVAVGDPDQTIMGFTGAHPRYFLELAARNDVHKVTLQLNYRHGSAIIAASQAALGAQRDYRPDPARDDAGTLEILSVPSGLDGHAKVIVDQIRALHEAGTASHDIAVLYPRRGALLNELTKALDAAGLSYAHDRDSRIPDAPIVDFISAAAARAIAGPQPVGWSDRPHAGAAVRSLGDLSDDYDRLRIDSKLAPMPGYRTVRCLTELLDARTPWPAAERPLVDWLAELATALDLNSIADRSPDERDQTAIQQLSALADGRELQVHDLASQGFPLDKIALTTYHSAKGCEWPVVLLPGLVDGIVPYRPWDRTIRDWKHPTGSDLGRARRELYVAISRARHAAVLVHGSGWHGRYGFVELGPSPFIRDIEASLG